MTYDISLKLVAIVLGFLAVVKGSLGIIFSEKLRLGMRGLARNYKLGIFLMILAISWSLWLVSFVDLGEYSGLRHWIMLGIFLLGVATIIFLPDLLTARALGVLLLLGAEVLLSAAFPVETSVRYVITLLAYVWAILGMIFVASPYRFRDLLFWFCDSNARFIKWSWIKFGLGLILIGLGLFVY